ncbi:MAG: tRNA (cytidine(34)-2'-O)-methyltransferase [Planctomycetota bacterium]
MTPADPPNQTIPPQPLFEVVLFEPQIPNNTGNIGRTCLAMASSLHLIEPLGFDLSEKALRRAGLDYWPRLETAVHEDWSSYVQSTPGARRWMFTTNPAIPNNGPAKPVFRADLRQGDHFVFGPETRGLPRDLLETHAQSNVIFPLVPEERSLNLATTVCAALTEGVRQLAQSNSIQISRKGRIVIPARP